MTRSSKNPTADGSMAKSIPSVRVSRWFSLRTRVVLLVVLAVMPSLFLIWRTAVLARQSERDFLRRDAMGLARLSALEEEQLIGQTRELLRALAESQEIRHRDWEACRRLMARIQAQRTRYRDLGVITADGLLVCSANAPDLPRQVKDRELVDQALARGDLAIGRLRWGQKAGAYKVSMALPIPVDGGEKAAVIYATLNVSWLQQREWQTFAKLPAGSTLWKLDRDGRVVACWPENEGAIGKELPFPEVLRALLRHANGVVETRGSGGWRGVFAFAPVRTTFAGGEMYVVLGIPREALFADIDRALRRDLRLLSLLALAAFGVAWVGSDYFLLRRIRALTNASRRLAEGDLTARTGISYGPGELSQLAKAFDTMAEALEERESALRVSEERYRRLFNEALTGNFVSRPDGKLLACNEAYARILGFSSVEEALNTDLVSIYLKPEDRAEILARLRAERRLEFHEMELRRRDGQTVRVLEHIIGTFDGAGELVQLHGYMIDISKLRRVEAQLRQAQKMEAIGRLAGAVAHDFNNILQALLSQVHLVEGAANDPQRVRELARDIAEQLQRGAALTRQLLIFSRQQPTQWELLDLNEVVQTAMRILRRLVRENIATDVEVAAEPLVVKADRGQLEQVLMNLVVNACDAMPTGGRLVIRTGGDPGDWVWLEVEDSGTGIPEDIRDRIFEPFFTTKPREKGTGLGLSVVHGIITGHGGRIEVTSEVGRGSVFRVLLPRQREEVSGPRASTRGEPAQLPQGQGERVLLVEDEEGARTALQQILLALGYEVVAVASGEEALQLPPEAPFHLLLTDLLLPGIDGPTMARELRQRWPNLEVLMMSGYAEDEAVRRGISAGEIRFLQKPFDMPTLARELRLALEGRGQSH
ncbi:MAG: ATP-binding protein [Acidobacteriota bacterium]